MQISALKISRRCAEKRMTSLWCFLFMLNQLQCNIDHMGDNVYLVSLVACWSLSEKGSSTMKTLLMYQWRQCAHTPPCLSDCDKVLLSSSIILSKAHRNPKSVLHISFLLYIFKNIYQKLNTSNNFKLFGKICYFSLHFIEIKFKTSCTLCKLN